MKDRPSRFLLSTDPGIEEIVAEELRERVGGVRTSVAPYALPGQLLVSSVAAEDVLSLRTIHHVIEVRGEAEAESLDDVRRAVGGLPFDELRDADSFRVSSVREGMHEFERRQIQGAAGAVLQKRYGTRVDLEHPAIDVRVNLYGNRLVAGIQLTRESLGNRVARGRSLRSSLRPTIAAAMLRLAGAHRGPGRLIDPMCGAAVIPVEAALANPSLSVEASDWDSETVETAAGTLRNHRLELPLSRFDARSLGRTRPGEFDFIVTDPPYGVRQGRHARLGELYRSLLHSFERALAPSGKIVLIVLKHRVFLAALERTRLRATRRLQVQAGSIRPQLFLLESASDSG